MSAQKKQRLLDALDAFLNTPVETQLRQGTNTDPSEAVLRLFHSVATAVPA